MYVGTCGLESEAGDGSPALSVMAPGLGGERLGCAEQVGRKSSEGLLMDVGASWRYHEGDELEYH